MHIVSHRTVAQDRLARVIPSMHVHLCVALWLISLHPSPFPLRSVALLPALPDVFLRVPREVEVQSPVRLPLGDRGHFRPRDTPHIVRAQSIPHPVGPLLALHHARVFVLDPHRSKINFVLLYESRPRKKRARVSNHVHNNVFHWYCTARKQSGLGSTTGNPTDNSYPLFRKPSSRFLRSVAEFDLRLVGARNNL